MNKIECEGGRIMHTEIDVKSAGVHNALENEAERAVFSARIALQCAAFFAPAAGPLQVR